MRQKFATLPPTPRRSLVFPKILVDRSKNRRPQAKRGGALRCKRELEGLTVHLVAWVSVPAAR